MAFHTIYRSSPGENRKARPPFYSKVVALQSFLAALEHAPPGDRVFVNDRQLDAERATLVAAAGEVIALGGVGNAGSYRVCLSEVERRPWADDDIVYFAEEDYLYHPNALGELARAATELPHVDYFTLYDNPDYRNLRRHRRFSRRHPRAHVVGSTSWVGVQSTCLTFGARVRALREDSWAHYLCSRESPPGDYALWATVIGSDFAYWLPRLVGRAPRPSLRNVAGTVVRRNGLPTRALVVSRPSLATHLEADLLAPGQDWSALASRAARSR